MERRLKLALVSMSDMIVYSKDSDPEYINNCILRGAPEGTHLITKENSLETGSLKIVAYNPKWEIVKPGALLRIFIIKPKHAEARVLKPFNH